MMEVVQNVEKEEEQQRRKGNGESEKGFVRGKDIVEVFERVRVENKEILVVVVVV